MQILLANSNTNMLTTWSSMVRRLGHEPLTARNGPDAQALAERLNLRIALIDPYVLGGISGMEVARRLRAACPDIRLVLSPNNRALPISAPNLSAIADAILFPPWQPWMLGEVMRVLLGVEPPPEEAPPDSDQREPGMSEPFYFP